MSYFPGLKLTKAGEQLLAKVSGNLSETISFRKAELGSGTINSDDEIRFLTALKEKWKDVNISDCKIVGDEQTQVQIELQFDNAGINTNKIFRELGIYAAANDGREVLFAYSNAKENFDYIPAATDNPQSFVINILITITSNTKVNAQIDLNSYVTLRKFNEELAKKLDKGAVSSEYDTAKKIEDKIKTAQSTANNKLDKGTVSAEYNTAAKMEAKIKVAQNTANSKLDKGTVPEKYNTAEKIGNEIDLKQNKTDNSLKTKDKNIPGAINELYNSSWKFTEKRLEGAIDFNSIKEAGFYLIDGSGAGATNAPFNERSIVEVLYAGREIIQISHCYFNSMSKKRWTTDGVNWSEWVETLSIDNKFFLGNSGVSKILNIQDSGEKTRGNGYVDKVTGKLYICMPENDDVDSVNDTTVTSNFILATNIENAKNIHSHKILVSNIAQTLFSVNSIVIPKSIKKIIIQGSTLVSDSTTEIYRGEVPKERTKLYFEGKYEADLQFDKEDKYFYYLHLIDVKTSADNYIHIIGY